MKLNSRLCVKYLLFYFILLSYDFTPLDYSAVYVLSSMARRRRTSQSSGGAVSPDREPLKGTEVENTKLYRRYTMQNSTK